MVLYWLLGKTSFADSSTINGVVAESATEEAKKPDVASAAQIPRMMISLSRIETVLVLASAEPANRAPRVRAELKHPGAIDDALFARNETRLVGQMPVAPRVPRRECYATAHARRVENALKDA